MGNALALPFERDSFDFLMTSPSYGNRMADHHNARDDSKRITYRHYYGEDLHDDNSGTMQWGTKYQEFHHAAWTEAMRVLKPGGIFVVNISKHVRGGVVQKVVEWHTMDLLALGLGIEYVERVRTPRMRRGERTPASGPRTHSGDARGRAGQLGVILKVCKRREVQHRTRRNSDASNRRTSNEHRPHHTHAYWCWLRILTTIEGWKRTDWLAAVPWKPPTPEERALAAALGTEGPVNTATTRLISRMRETCWCCILTTIEWWVDRYAPDETGYPDGTIRVWSRVSDPRCAKADGQG